MKQHLSLLFSILPAVAAAQTEAPGTLQVNELDEVTVVAANQRAGASETVYIPSTRQKTAAADGVSLLARMNIPQLSVNLVAETVKTASGQAVSLFINRHPASAEDVAGLNPSDVLRVEYLDFPSDPRFLGAEHVVNFLLREYAWGGYTKLAGKERVFVNSGDASVYSKFAYRKMEYDLMVDGGYDSNGHLESNSHELYRLTSGDVERDSRVTASRRRQRDLFAGFRASWNKSEALTWRNFISVSRNHTPVETVAGDVTFSRMFPSGSYASSSKSGSTASDFESELYASFSHGWSLQSDLSGELLNNSSSGDYDTMLTSLHNDADERTGSANLRSRLDKRLSRKISLFANLLGSTGRTRINYAGTSDAVNTFHQWFGGCALGVSLTLDRLSGSIDAGYAFESNSINGLRDDDSYPFTHVNLQYVPNQRNSFSIWFQYATMSPGATMKNPNMIQQTELMYVAGNPLLKRSRHVSANLSYTWLPDNRWQLTAYATFFKISNRQVPVYFPDAPGGMMLKRYANSGDYNHGQLGARLTAKFLDGRLNVSLAPRLLMYETTGENRMSHYPFSASVSADYYLGNFFFSAFYESRTSYVDGETCFLRKMPSDYAVTAGWAAKGWNVSIGVANFLRSSWRVSTDTFTSRYYDSRETQFGNDFHRRLNLSVTYTFTYGKRVDATDVISSASASPSSILR